MPRYMMAIETKFNWEKDKKNGFRFLGVSEYKVGRAKLVSAGDVIFVYVPSPQCSFSDIRMAVKDGAHNSPQTREYDVPCYAGLITESVVALDPEKWLSIKGLIGALSFLRPVPKWGIALQNSFREITAKDAAVIVNGMSKLNPEADWSHVRGQIGLLGKGSNVGRIVRGAQSVMK